MLVVHRLSRPSATPDRVAAAGSVRYEKDDPMNNDPSVHNIVASALITESPDVLKANATFLFNLSVQHLLGAARISRYVGEIERRHTREQFGEFWDEILQ